MDSVKKRIIRKEAQHIKATFQIGVGEVHEKNRKAIQEAFNNKEIVKVRVNKQDKDDKTIVKEIAEKIIRGSEVEIAGVIGNTIILFKKTSKESL